ncbi:MAG TPA: hypothetical protein VK662_00815 [Acidothermaceae bacterium]|jgi:hypothetical protein|nr:hypothetical protein [Acidothermaceae bacterium]
MIDSAAQLTGPLQTLWLIVFGVNYAAMIGAAGRVRPFNTSRIFTKHFVSAGTRFFLGVLMLNALPFGFAFLVASHLSAWFPVINWWSVVALTTLSLTTHAFWRFFAAVCDSDFLFGGETAIADVRKELTDYGCWRHIAGGLIYAILFPGIAWLLARQ